MGISSNTYLIIAIPALIVLALLLRIALQKDKRGKVPPPAKRPNQPQSRPASRNPYRATSIAVGDNACLAAQALAGKRYLVADNNIPQLPLGDCDVANCACIYAHHLDRREDGVLRRAPSSLRTTLHSATEQVEQRTTRGRRSSDWE